MTEWQAQAIKIGDVVTYRGKRYTVASICLKGIGAPLFRLNSVHQEDGGGALISYTLCGLPLKE